MYKDRVYIRDSSANKKIISMCYCFHFLLIFNHFGAFVSFFAGFFSSCEGAVSLSFASLPVSVELACSMDFAFAKRCGFK